MRTLSIVITFFLCIFYLYNVPGQSFFNVNIYNFYFLILNFSIVALYLIISSLTKRNFRACKNEIIWACLPVGVRTKLVSDIFFLDYN